MSSQCPKNLVSPFWHSSPHLLSPVPLNALPAGKKQRPSLPRHIYRLHSPCPAFLSAELHLALPPSVSPADSAAAFLFSPPNVPTSSTSRVRAQLKSSTMSRDPKSQCTRAAGPAPAPLPLFENPRILRYSHRHHGMDLSVAPSLQVVTPSLRQMGAEQELNFKGNHAP